MVITLTYFEENLFLYCQRMQNTLEEDLHLLKVNMSVRAMEPLDHLEMIMAEVRLATVEKIFRDIGKIVEISKGK